MESSVDKYDALKEKHQKLQESLGKQFQNLDSDWTPFFVPTKEPGIQIRHKIPGNRNHIVAMAEELQPYFAVAMNRNLRFIFEETQKVMDEELDKAKKDALKYCESRVRELS